MFLDSCGSCCITFPTFQNDELLRNPTFERFLASWRTFAEQKQAPEGFGKFAKGKEEAKEAPKSEEAASKIPKEEKNDWNFGMFANTAKTGGKGSGGSGRPIGGEGGEGREKWMLFGAIGTVAFLGALAYLEMGYKEIGWREFVTR